MITALAADVLKTAIAVADRFGMTQAVSRHRLAGPVTPLTAREKAWTAVSFRTNTTDIVPFSPKSL
jgi:uncharacterized protein GlcG (DUF336 family)